MGLLEAMTVLADDWDDVQRRLEPVQARGLRELVAEFTDESDPRVSSDTAEDIMDVLTQGLPVTHPVLRALMSHEDRSRGRTGHVADSAWSRLAGSLRARLESGPPGTPFGDDGDLEGGPAGTSFGDYDDDAKS